VKFLGFFISFFVTASLITLLNRPFDKIPPIGKLLSPHQGFWQNSEKEPISLDQSIKLIELKEVVTVQFDELLIPHINAKNIEDLYMTQGYVTAYHRLWQMDFYARVVMGRLSEVVGIKALGYDRLQRRLGLKDMTLKLHDGLMKDDYYASIISAYTNGVNAYIASLSQGDYPIEFKLLNYEPEKWTTVKTCMAYALLASTLSRSEADIEHTNFRKMFGEDLFNVLFPEPDGTSAPVIPRDTPFGFEPMSRPQKPEKFEAQHIVNESISKQNPLNGSNNFAIDSTKSKSGHAILANEPDLELTAPSIWYASHLTSPDINVMGVTVPGTPVILIGFNDSISWGVTNSPRDQVDWFSVTFKDTSRKEYLYNNQWFKTEQILEEIVIKNADNFIDTIIRVHHGPIVYDRDYLSNHEKVNLAMRWIAHDESTTFKALFHFNKANNYDEFVEGLRFFSGPPQNIIYSDTKGNIALNLPGKFPIKFPGQGKFILDGSDPDSEWKKYIPFEHRLERYNHPQGFLSSANQFPVDRTTYPYYVYSHRFENYRNRRVNERLITMKNIEPEDLMSLQNDNFNYIASEILPYLLSQLDTLSLNEDQNKFFYELQNWDYFNHPNLKAPTNFELWSDILSDQLWDEFDTMSFAVNKPDIHTTSQLIISDSLVGFSDRLSTPEKETTPDLINYAFYTAVDSLNQWLSINGKNHSWNEFKETEINHLISSFTSFNSKNISIGGNHNIVNAVSKHHGPSWRMVVEMDPQGINAYGVYPGSQTGNPGNPMYGHMITAWAEGKYYNLKFGQNKMLAGDILYEIQLTP